MVVAVATSVAVALFLLLQVLTLAGSASPTWLEADLVFEHPASRAEALVARMDGHFAAELAADPTLDRTRRDFRHDPADGAYRSTRPVMGWLAWAASGGGRRPGIAPALLALTALAAGALTLAVIAAGRSIRGRPRWPAIVNLAPGAAIAVFCPGLTEVLATALVVGGFALHRRGARRPAMVLFVAAVLTRETTILVPAALALVDLRTTRRLASVAIAAVPAAAYLAWNLVVASLLGTGAAGGGSNQMTFPGVGLVRALAFWGPLEVISAAVLVASAVVVWRAGDPSRRTFVAVHVGFASLMGRVVWAEWWGFGRVMLPLVAIAVAGGALGWLSPGVDREPGSGTAPAPPVSALSG